MNKGDALRLKADTQNCWNGPDAKIRPGKKKRSDGSEVGREQFDWRFRPEPDGIFNFQLCF
jgi:hypothetical protein